MAYTGMQNNTDQEKNMNKNYFTLLNKRLSKEIFLVEADIIALLDCSFEGSIIYDSLDTYRGTKNFSRPIRTREHHKKAAFFDEIRIEVKNSKIKTHKKNEKILYEHYYYVSVPEYNRRICLKTELLAQCYKKCLIKASESGANSIVFDLFTGGEYKPIQAYDIARDAINEIAPKLRKMSIMVNVNDVYTYSKLLRFETFLNRINQDSDANTNQMDISEKLKMYSKFDQQESKLMLALREHETDYAAAAGEINEQYSNENAEMSKQDFSKKMIAEVINNWINSPLQSEKKQKYERKTRSASSLAKLISASPSTVSKLSNGKGNLPSREMLISLAIGMQLDREERLHFILYGNDNLKYPQNLKEEFIEEILCDPNQNHDFNSVNNKVNEKFDETIRKPVERKENTFVKKKKHKKSNGKEK